MGVSVETSGIKVESDKCYLVNLNADPSLNELLVYYLKDVTKVGSGDNSLDIQLNGLGISADHCTICIENRSEVYITPVQGARTCINGSLIQERTRAKHGDRILWGNNHFFRLNIPRRGDMMTSSAELADELHVDYDFAQQEIMQQAHDPIQESIEAIERQYENDKQAALDAQKQMYEEQMLMLRSQLSTGSPVPWNHYLAGSHSSNAVNDRLQRKIQQMAQERNSKFKQGLTKLKEELMRVNMYTREANELAQELHITTTYNVTLQIPACNLSPNRRRGALMSEPAILARNHEDKTQVFSMEEFESQLVLMREVYQDHRDQGPLHPSLDSCDNPFLVTPESHALIGVANVFLDALFYDVKLDYYVAIINQQGEVAGRLHVELTRLEGSLNDSFTDVSSISSEDSHTFTSSREIKIKVCIRDAKGLPPALSNFVFCQFTFWGDDEAYVVPPKVDESLSESSTEGAAGCRFDHEQEFTIAITEEFTEHLYDGALSIEVYGHSAEEGKQASTVRSLADRWSEVTRKLELGVEIQELNDQGVYEPVEVQVKPDVYCGGVFQLRQGYSRRIVVNCKPDIASGSLPLTVDSITGVSVGGLCIRSHTHKGLDSYQEDGLTLLRSRWNEALEKRKQYLDDRMQMLAAKDDKTESDIEREKNLMSQWLSLAEERNDVLVPQAGSGVPGAPATGEHAFGLEHHCPVIYLDLNIEDMTPRHSDDDVPVAELAILDKEMNTTFLTLPVVQTDVSCIIASWDSSIHDSIHLNRVTPPNERIYMIVKAYVRLSHPAPIDMTLRKRICLNIYKHQSLTMKLRKKISKTANTMGATHNAVGRLLHVQDNLTSCGILYDIVSSIPKASEELEDRETMAKLAASGYETQISTDGESYIEKYIKSVAAVESIITLDRLGQEVAIKDSLLAAGRTPKRTFSSPNISAMMKTSTSTPSFADKMKSPLASSYNYLSTAKVRLSESFQDLSRHVMKPSASTESPLAQKTAGRDDYNNHSKPKLSGDREQSDRSPTADEGYGSTPRRSNAGDNHHSSLSASRREKLDSSVHTEDSRKTLNFDNIQTTSEGSSQSEPVVVQTSVNDISTENQPIEIPNPTFQTASSSQQVEITNSVSQLTLQSQTSTELHTDTAQPDPDITPTRQITSTTTTDDVTSAGQFHKIVAPLASVDSDCGTADSTPKHCPVDTNTKPELYENEDNELLIVEDGDNHVSKVTESLITSVTESEASYNDDEELDSYSEQGATKCGKKTRVDMLSDIYSMNALDELEALGDSMESLNSCCSTDDTSDDLQPSKVKVVQPPKAVQSKAQPLLVDDSDSDDASGDEAASICSFGSMADLSDVNSPLPAWVEIGVPVIILSTKGEPPERGYIRYVGDTDFAVGSWVGVQLDNMKGKNDGTVKGTAYFDCKPKHGVFVRHDRLMMDKKRNKKTFPLFKVNLRSSFGTPSPSLGQPTPVAVSTPSYLKPTKSSRLRKS